MQEQFTPSEGTDAPVQESEVSINPETYDGPTDVDGLVAARRKKRQELAAQAEQAEPEATDAEDEETQPDADLEADGANEEILDDQTSEDVGEPDEVNPDEAAEDDEAPSAPIDAPHFWSAEGKEHFATLDPKTQQFVLDQDKQAQAFVTRTRQDLAAKVATEMRKANEERQAKLAQLDASITQTRNAIVKGYMALPEVKAAVLEGQVSEADLYAAADETLTAQKQELDSQEQEARASFLKLRNLELQNMESPLLDPAKAEPFIAWANSKGVTPDDIAQTEAAHLDIAYKAFLYEQGQDRLAARPKPKPKPPAKPVRPATKGSGQNPINARLKALEAKAKETGSLEDVLALKKAKRMAGAA